LFYAELDWIAGLHTYDASAALPVRTDADAATGSCSSWMDWKMNREHVILIFIKTDGAGL
jgi:hypothetical protein